MPVFDEAKCVVCGCTDGRACEEGCSWEIAGPPVCSSCVAKYLVAGLMDVVFKASGVGRKGPVARAASEIRELYGRVEAARFGLPTLREITAINRREQKWMRANVVRRPRARKGR